MLNDRPLRIYQGKETRYLSFATKIVQNSIGAKVTSAVEVQEIRDMHPVFGRDEGEAAFVLKLLDIMVARVRLSVKHERWFYDNDTVRNLVGVLVLAQVHTAVAGWLYEDLYGWKRG